jgi:hypothetical protein
MKIKRYQAVDLNGKVIASGKTLESVQGPGNRIILDYKAKRYHVQGLYPLTVAPWINPSPNCWPSALSKIGDMIRAN